MTWRYLLFFGTFLFPITAEAQFSISSINATCFNDCDGSARITPSSGYQYHWNNGNTTADNSNICAGTYTCIVSDTFGFALDTLTTVITQPTEFNFTYTIDSSACPGAKNGVITILAGGGVSPYYYSVNKPDSALLFSPDSIFTGLDTGWYSLIIADRNECYKTDSAYVGLHSLVCTSVEDPGRVKWFTLLPNPVKDIATVNYELSEPATLEFGLYDLAGRKVEFLFKGQQSKGSHTMTFRLKELSAGEYILNVRRGGESFNARLVKQ